VARRQVIVTADDFGLAPAVNDAVELAHREGILGCASLMVGAPAAADAVARARRLPGLRVGLHVVLVDGHPVLPPEQVPDLVDGDGEFSRRLVSAGVRFFFLPRVRRQLEAEIRAQFTAFRDTGLALDHVNAHKHMHLHPTVLSTILRVGRQFGMHAMRIPYEPLGASRRIIAGGPWSRLGAQLLLRPWVQLLQWRMRRAGVLYNEYVFGLSTSGAMDEDTVLRIVDSLPPGVSEIYFHPATAAGAQPLPMPAQRHAAELHALTSPRVRDALAAAGIQSISFSELHH
jgi:hopanoid biosynthesis associated protein HpnK